MLVGTAKQFPLASPMESATSISRPRVRPAITTSAPRRAKAWATSRPRPLPPPVTTATVPSKSPAVKTETAGPGCHVTARPSPGEVPAFALLVVVQDVLGDEDAVHLVGTVGQAQRAGAEVHLGQREVTGHAGRPPDLDGPVDDPAVGRRHEDLDGADLGAGLGVALVDLLGRMDRHQPGGLQVHVAVGHEALHELLVPEEATVHLAGQQALDHQVEGAPHLADGVHAVEDATGPQPVLGRPVPVADLAEQVLVGDA